MMKFLTISTGLLLGLFIFSQVDAKQKYYKWTDADGNIHYSTTKPRDIRSNEIKVSTRKPVSVAKTSEPEPNAEQEKTPAQKAVDEYNQSGQAKVTAKQNKENCKVAKKNLATLQHTVRVSKTNPATGEIIRMDDTQRIKMIQASKKAIKELCK